MLFNSQAQELTSGYENATAQNVSNILQKLDQVQPGSGTDLYSGLKAGISHLDADRSTAIVRVTDGVANVGETEKGRFIELLKKRDVRLFTFIMGNSANKPLLEEMTRVSHGFAMAVSNADDIVGQLVLATGKLTHKALRDVSIEVNGVRSKGVVTP